MDKERDLRRHLLIIASAALSFTSLCERLGGYAHACSRGGASCTEGLCSMIASGALRDVYAWTTPKTTYVCDRHLVGHRHRERGSTRAQEQGLLPTSMPVTGTRATKPRHSVMPWALQARWTLTYQSKKARMSLQSQPAHFHSACVSDPPTLNGASPC